MFQTSNRIKIISDLKDRAPETLQSNFIRKFKWWSCTDLAQLPITEKPRHMKVRVSEHQDVPPRTGKEVKGTLSTSVRDRMLKCNHVVAWKDLSIIGRESNHYLLETKGSLK